MEDLRQRLGDAQHEEVPGIDVERQLDEGAEHRVGLRVAQVGACEQRLAAALQQLLHLGETVLDLHPAALVEAEGLGRVGMDEVVAPLVGEEQLEVRRQVGLQLAEHPVHVDADDQQAQRRPVAVRADRGRDMQRGLVQRGM